eukprot:TRINITY_DN13621_c0_g2_i1.p1 TRINITY_DN13621_c0_g2~~TRINITY_DN13621_c0_g2_i1.p1  ORF type:complete len:739 (+),score=148.89 TRINITY_DN13621_c0_g2_i1:90-2306(+)
MNRPTSREEARVSVVYNAGATGNFLAQVGTECARRSSIRNSQMQAAAMYEYLDDVAHVEAAAKAEKAAIQEEEDSEDEIDMAYLSGKFLNAGSVVQKPLAPGEFFLQVYGVFGTDINRPRLDNMCVAFRVRESDTVWDVKYRIWIITNLLPFIQTLYVQYFPYQDEMKLLNDEELLEDHEIPELTQKNWITLGGPPKITLVHAGFSEDEGNRLLQAARDGDEETALAAIRARGAPCHINEETEESGMHGAAHSGSIELLKFLLEYKATVDRLMGDGLAPIHVAAAAGQTKAIDFLLERDAQIERADEAGYRSIHHAAKGGHLEAVKTLVAHGAEVNCTCEVGWSPLHLATSFGHVPVIEFLCENGADFAASTVDDAEQTALHISASNGLGKVVKALCNAGADPKAHMKGGWSPLHLAVLLGKNAVLKSLLHGKAEINQLMPGGESSLIVAVASGSTDITNILLKWSANKEIAMEGGVTVLHVAVSSGNLGIAKMLLKGGAYIDKQRSIDNRSCLIVAVTRQDMKMATLLLSNEAAIDIRDADGFSALHHAAELGDTKLCELLCKHKANVNLPVYNGKTLTGYNGGRFTPLFIASDNNREETVAALIKKKADPKLASDDGRTPLHAAASKGLVSVCSKLLAANADPNALTAGDIGGMTPLHAAAHQGHSDVIDLLVTEGGNINAQTKDEWTPVICALQNGCSDAAELLRDKGADIDMALRVAEALQYTPLIAELAVLKS